MAVKPKSPQEILERIHKGSETVPPQPHLSFDFGEYVNTATRIRFRDSEHGEFEAVPAEILRGKKQHPKRLKNQRGLTVDEIQAEVIRIHPYMRLDESTYKGLSIQARFIDEKFGEYWAEPQFVIKHHQTKHPKRDAFIRALPAAEVQRRIQEGYQKYPSRPFMRLVEETYESVDKKALFVDDEYGEWWAFPNNIMKGQCHPKRTGNPVYTIEDVKKALSNRPEITLDESTFVNVTTKARFIDVEYGEWWVQPQRLMLHKNRRHQARQRQKAIIPPEQVQERIKKLFPHVTLDFSTYKKSLEPARFIDEKYGEWWAKPNSVLMGHGHPARAVTLRKLEEKVADLLEITRYGATPEWLLPEKSKIKPDFKLTEDIYLEADGIFWHSEIRVEDKYSHLKRRELFKKYGKRLFQFREDEIRQKPDIVKSIVWNALGKNSEKIFARKCEITSEFDAKAFFHTNHLMGYTPAKSLALSYRGEIIAAMSYRVVGQEFHVSRFCTKPFISVVGGFSRLLKKALEISQFKKGEIINYVDLRYGTGKHLLEHGFHLEKTTLGWQWTDGVNTFNRLRCRANMDERKLTQAQHAQELGWYKIYDAGQAKYVKCLDD
jgi:hypothetical protein